jgi:6-phosphogluconolactonase (cycloisomerase 2 family)
MKALAASLAVGLGMTACSRDYVLGYLYATNAKATPGLITAYSIDYETGALNQLADSPIPSGGNDPVAIVASPNGKQLYVLNNQQSNVVAYNIGTDGKIYASQTVSVVSNGKITGTLPTAAAVDAGGKFLFITFTYQNGYTPVLPGPGGLATFPINADGTLGTALTNTTIGTTAANPLPYIPLGDNPVGIAIPATGGFVYVIDQENPQTASAHGVLLSFQENTSTGALTAITGNYPSTTYPSGVPAGTTPSAIAEDPSGRFIYVTDEATNQLYGYTVNSTPLAGTPTAMVNSPFATGLYPLGLTVDPRGEYVYVANFSSSTVSAYVINGATGALSGAAGGVSVATGPTCVTIDPALGIYLYTSNQTDNSISAEQLNPHSGALTQVQGTQFSSQALPTCVVAVANGAHATQIVN